VKRLGPVLIAGLMLAFPAVGSAQFDGSLDPGFDGPAGGGNGKFLLAFNDQDDQATDVLVQADGKILVVGRTDVDLGAPQEFQLALARFNGTNGSLDATFDGPSGTGNGDFSLDLSAVAGGETVADAVTLDSQGRIVIGGSVDVAGNGRDHLVVRLDAADGDTDPSFGGGDGFATAQFSAGDDLVGAIATDSGDRPVTVGTTANDFTVARFEADGDPDNSFGSAGLKIVGIEPGTQDNGNSVLIQPDGKIVIGARSHIAATSFDWGLARLMPADGSLDPTFDGPAGTGNGAFRLPLSAGQDVGQAMVMQGTDKILIAGEAGPSFNAGIARIDVSDGDLDDSFDGDGLVVTDFGTGGEQFLDIEIDSKGRIVAAGVASPSGSDFAAARYSADGIPDPFFDGDSGSGDGEVIVPFAATDSAAAIGVEADGDLVLVGGSGNGSADDFALARLNVDLIEPNTFTTGPSGPTNVSNPSFSISSNETASSVQCTIDAVPVACGIGAGQQFGPFADGPHTLTAAAVDQSGNVDGEPATRSFTVDTVAPSGSITGGTGLTNDSTPSVSFTSSEAGSTFQCKLDPAGGPAGSFAPCASPLTVGPLPDGTSTFTVRNTDAATNVDPSDAVASITVDTAAPTATITAGPPAKLKTRKRRARASFQFSSNDPSATLECSLDGAAFASCASPFAATLRLGSHTFSVRAQDAAGNVSPAVSRTVKVKKAKRRK
jgi:uncharacterized delta-60 repeat protein